MTAKLTGNLKPLRAMAPARSVRAALPQRAYTPTPRYAAQAAARYVPAKAVGTFVPGLTRKAFEKFGFAAATLITGWAEIAGRELASYTLPERLKWPRAAGTHDESGEQEGRPGATLILRVDPARALDVEYKTRQIIERINAYFGYRAVAALRLIQAPLPEATLQPAAAPLPAPKPDARPSDPLAAALARLEQGIKGRKSGKTRAT